MWKQVQMCQRNHKIMDYPLCSRGILNKEGDKMENQQQQITNGKAIASMVLGILSIIIPYIGIILGILGIIFAKKSFGEINANNQNGRGMAITGLTTSIIGLAIYVLLILIILLIGGLASIGNNL